MRKTSNIRHFIPVIQKVNTAAVAMVGLVGYLMVKLMVGCSNSIKINLIYSVCGLISQQDTIIGD